MQMNVAGLLILLRISYHSPGHLHYNVVRQIGYDGNTVSHFAFVALPVVESIVHFQET